jgi:hypothetical protein
VRREILWQSVDGETFEVPGLRFTRGGSDSHGDSVVIVPAYNLENGGVRLAPLSPQDRRAAV